MVDAVATSYTQARTEPHLGPLSAHALDRCAYEIHAPFYIFAIEGFLSESAYSELERQFPARDQFPKALTGKGDKRYMDNRMPEFFAYLKRYPRWGELYRAFFEPSVVDRFYRMVAAARSDRPRHQQYPWKLSAGHERSAPIGKAERFVKRQFGALQGRTPTEVGFQFSYLDGGNSIPPHTDTPGKLLSLMLYFPDPGVSYQGAGTEFYRGRDGKQAWPGWRGGLLSDEKTQQFFAEHEVFHNAEFTPNTLVGFVKSSSSWHGLKKLNLPAGATRRSVNINYYYL